MKWVMLDGSFVVLLRGGKFSRCHNILKSFVNKDVVTRPER